MTTVVVPSHNEGAVIERLLGSLLVDARPGEFDVVVVCNGCVDDTAERARRQAAAHPGYEVMVLELAEASKVAALNAGLAAATTTPVLFVDADIRITAATARAVTGALAEPGILAASTSIDLDLDGASMLSRSYHRLWRRVPSIAGGLVGRGIYGLSDVGLQRLGRFPPVLADDRLVDLLFAPAERRIVPESTIVTVSRTARELIHRKTRVFAGNDRVEADLPEHPSIGTWRDVVRRHPASAIDLPAYLGINLAAKTAARWIARQGRVGWNQDTGSRATAP